MTTRRRDEQLWHTTETGLVIPIGMASDFSETSTETYLEIKEKAKSIERIYADNNISLPPTCDLACLIGDAKVLSDSWLTNNTDVTTHQLLFRVSLLNRIADAILLLPEAEASDRVKFLTVFTSGSLNLQQRDNSLAKNMLWELELWSILRRRSFSATLREPPDIVVIFEGAMVGIACKKLYSENNVEKVLSEAVGQIEAVFDYGIVAVNLDDLILPDQILKARDQEEMGKIISDLNLAFLNRHKRHFRKYLAPGRLLSAIVSTTVLAETYHQRPRFNVAQQATIWAIPGLPREKKKHLQRFYAQLMK